MPLGAPRSARGLPGPIAPPAVASVALLANVTWRLRIVVALPAASSSCTLSRCDPFGASAVLKDRSSLSASGQGSTVRKALLPSLVPPTFRHDPLPGFKSCRETARPSIRNTPSYSPEPVSVAEKEISPTPLIVPPAARLPPTSEAVGGVSSASVISAAYRLIATE